MFFFFVTIIKKSHKLTEAPRSQEDTSYSVSITLPGHPDEDTACHNAEQGCAHP